MSDDDAVNLNFDKSSFEDYNILVENAKRTEKRYKNSLVVFGSNELVISQDTIHALCEEITSVRILNDNFVLIFKDELTCLRSFKDLSMRNYNGNIKLRVEFYKSMVSEQEFREKKLNRKSLLAQGIPKSMTEEVIRNLFPNCLNIYFSKISKGKTPYAVINFYREEDTLEAFKKSENLVVHGFAIDVHYSFIPRDETLNKKEVLVYGLSGTTTLNDVKKVFVNAVEITLKHNKFNGEDAPFSYLAKFENEAHAANLFKIVNSLGTDHGKVTAQHSKIKFEKKNSVSFYTNQQPCFSKSDVDQFPHKISSRIKESYFNYVPLNFRSDLNINDFKNRQVQSNFDFSNDDDFLAQNKLSYSQSKIHRNKDHSFFNSDVISSSYSHYIGPSKVSPKKKQPKNV